MEVERRRAEMRLGRCAEIRVEQHLPVEPAEELDRVCGHPHSPDWLHQPQRAEQPRGVRAECQRCPGRKELGRLLVDGDADVLAHECDGGRQPADPAPYDRDIEAQRPAAA